MATTAAELHPLVPSLTLVPVTKMEPDLPYSPKGVLVSPVQLVESEWLADAEGKSERDSGDVQPLIYLIILGSMIR